MKRLIAFVFFSIAVGCFSLHDIHLCGVDEFSNFEVKMRVCGGKSFLRVSGLRLYNSVGTADVNGILQKVCGRKLYLYAYIDSSWRADEMPMLCEVDVSRLDMVYFGDVLLWTRENGVEEAYRDVLRPIEAESETEWRMYLDAWMEAHHSDGKSDQAQRANRAFCPR